MELAVVILQIVLAIGQAIGKALGEGDWSVLDRPVRELLPEELKITAAKARAKAAADARWPEGDE